MEWKLGECARCFFDVMFFRHWCDATSTAMDFSGATARLVHDIAVVVLIDDVAVVDLFPPINFTCLAPLRSGLWPGSLCHGSRFYVAA
jgi:hypothetical protein